MKYKKSKNFTSVGYKTNTFSHFGIQTQTIRQFGPSSVENKKIHDCEYVFPTTYRSYFAHVSGPMCRKRYIRSSTRSRSYWCHMCIIYCFVRLHNNNNICFRHHVNQKNRKILFLEIAFSLFVQASLSKSPKADKNRDVWKRLALVRQTADRSNGFLRKLRESIMKQRRALTRPENAISRDEGRWLCDVFRLAKININYTRW